MGKGDSRKQKHKSNKSPQPQPQPEESNVLYLPGSPEYETSFQKIYGKPGPPGETGLPKAVVDLLGRPLKTETKVPEMPVKNSETQPVPRAEERPVLVCREPMEIKYPELWLGVYLVGPQLDCMGFPELLVRSDCYKVEHPKNADIVIFTGGADINPAIYGETPHPTVSWDSERDETEIALYEECLRQGIPMVGICRGAQLLHALNGGKLYQHVDGHQGDHWIYDTYNNTHIPEVSSVHHQMCMEQESMQVIATCAGKSNFRWLDDKAKETNKLSREIEAFWYPETACLGVQGHPEYRGYPRFSVWFMKLLEEFIIMNNDLDYPNEDKGPRRLRPEIIAMRKPFVNPLKKASEKKKPTLSTKKK